MKKLLVNIFGSPNVGKTTLAAGLFTDLKKKNFDVEIVPEFAKELILEGNTKALAHQWYVSGIQAYKIHCAYETMQVVISDSPILLAPIYDCLESSSLLNLSLEHHHRYNNFNIMLTPNPEFNHNLIGRIHSLTESQSISNRIHRFLEEHDIPFVEYNEMGYERIFQFIRSTLA